MQKQQEEKEVVEEEVYASGAGLGESQVWVGELCTLQHPIFCT